MSTSVKPATHAPTSVEGGDKPSSFQTSQFVVMALNMGWQLAVVILVPMGLGVLAGNAWGAKTAWFVAGFVVAMALSAAVVWRFYTLASKVPVPPLTAAQKARLKKLNEEDDD